MYNSNKNKKEEKEEEKNKRTARVSFSQSFALAMGEDNQSTAPVLNHRRPVEPFLETLEKVVKKQLDTLQTTLADILSDAADREKRYLRKI